MSTRGRVRTAAQERDALHLPARGSGRTAFLCQSTLQDCCCPQGETGNSATGPWILWRYLCRHYQSIVARLATSWPVAALAFLGCHPGEGRLCGAGSWLFLLPHCPQWGHPPGMRRCCHRPPPLAAALAHWSTGFCPGLSALRLRGPLTSLGHPASRALCCHLASSCPVRVNTPVPQPAACCTWETPWWGRARRSPLSTWPTW